MANKKGNYIGNILVEDVVFPLLKSFNIFFYFTLRRQPLLLIYTEWYSKQQILLLFYGLEAK